ncbi:MerR family transcriptional regulator [Streptomyces sp. 71268]|uniref:MerR family transcriptional regulator n=1 Tax=Streptomyces sp. 71268 TaxID=3002640 RepID=UPI0023F75643|nr:MerR family transcriptional regulator [Streptomyces sp. 71268]WEV28098.1 MerR family transcriptional regulator [Streptomyces sp. 71268]
MDQASGHGREYRVAELGRAAGVKVRNLRYYQGRGLLPPPRYEGRVALYSEAHLARLRLISDLLARGYPVNGIAELFAAWDRGSCLAEFLGYEHPARGCRRQTERPTPVVTCREELRERFGDQATEENLRRAAQLGYLRVDGETITHGSPELVDLAAELVRAGVPLDALLTAGAMVRDHTARLARHLVTAVRAPAPADPHDAPPTETPGPDTEPAGAEPAGAAPASAAAPPPSARRLARAVATLRPLAGEALGAEFARAVDRAVAAEYGAARRPARDDADPAR